MMVPKNILDLPDNMRSIVSMIDTMFDEVYLVGGAVRDVIINKKTNDLDFSTPDSVSDIKDKLESCGLFSVHTEGEKFGTISANIGDFDIQITSFRKEVYKEGSRKPLTFSISDIDGDLARRDFTINSIALSREELIDPYDGIESIKIKEIRSIGNPDVRFTEDPLRIIRAFRFVSQLGFNIDEGTLRSIIRNKDKLSDVSIERIGQELQKIIEGQCWDDAVSELIETGVLGVVLKKIGLLYGVSSDDAYSEFFQYSADQLNSMVVYERWTRFIAIIDKARKSSGVESIDINTLAEKILVSSQVNKADRNFILDNIHTSLVSIKEAPIRDDVEYAQQLFKDGISQKNNNDPKWMINIAKYHTIIGKNEIHKSQYAKAVKDLKEAIDISIANQKFILDAFKDREYEKIDKLKKLNLYLADRMRYYIQANIFADKLYSKFNDSSLFINFLHKKYKCSGISSEDMNILIEHVVAGVYKINPTGISLEDFMVFLNRNDLHMNKDDVIRYKKSYIESQIRYGKISTLDKSKLYLEKAKLSRLNRTDEELGFEYYDPYIDYLYNKMISQKKIDKFNYFYDKFVDMSDKYINLSKKWGRLKDGRRNICLTSASALTYAIQISESVDMRINLSRRIVDDYKEGRDLRNSNRYQIYFDWFTLAKLLLSTEYYSPENIKSLLKDINNLASVNYSDEDEEFLAHNKPDLVKKRDLMKDVNNILLLLNKTSIDFDADISDGVVQSIFVLTRQKILDKETSFILLKNYIARTEKEIESIDRIDVPDKLLTKNNTQEELDYLLSGESETIEYKSTWQLNRDKYLHSKDKTKENDPELKKEVIKNIAGMLNKQGGCVLIGVEDNSSICGLEDGDFLMQSSPDYRKKLDNIQLDIRNEIENRLGKEILAKLSISVIRTSVGDQNKTIIKIYVFKNDNGPVLYKDIEGELYFVRSGTSTSNAGMTSYAEAYANYRFKNK